MQQQSQQQQHQQQQQQSQQQQQFHQQSAMYNWPYSSSPSTATMVANGAMRPSYMPGPSQSPTPSGMMMLPPHGNQYYYPLTSPHPQSHLMMQSAAAASVATMASQALSGSNGYAAYNGAYNSATTPNHRPVAFAAASTPSAVAAAPALGKELQEMTS